MPRVRLVAALSLACTCLFFLEYLPPIDRVHIPYDLPGYFYPLADSAWQALRAGRFPQWDASIYCGIPFAGNFAAALFYPPLWLAFAANGGRHMLAFGWVEALVIAHVWLAFLLCFLWLRGKGLAQLPSALGAAVFACGGYLCQHWQHFGVACGYAWMPLGLWGIDEAAQTRGWRPLWKVTAASALCLLAGYPPLWFVFAVSMAAWALARGVAMRVLAAMAASLAIAAVQLLPAWYAAALKTPELNYGTGVRDPWYFIPLLLPNWADMALNAPGRREDQYLYLGAAAWLGLLLLVRARDRRAWPPMVVAAVALVFMTNPYGLVWAIIRRSDILAQLCRDWYFLAALPLAAAPLAALGLDQALRRKRAAGRPWAAALASLLLLGWAVRQIFAWARGGLATGWWSGAELAVTVALFALAVRILPGQKGVARAVLAAALLIAAGADYKAYGTSRRVNAVAGQPIWDGREERIADMDEALYRRLRDNRHYRVAVDLTAPWPQELRHQSLRTPQGFDALLPRQYRDLVESGAGRFRTNREIEIDPGNGAALRLFGIRYFVTSEAGPLFARLAESPQFHRIEPSGGYYKLFEYVDARPTYGWDSGGPEDRVLLTAGTPERRGFRVRSQSGGRFFLAEQFYPGWSASIDGRPVPLERWNRAFQAVRVPAGEHAIEFRYRAPGLLPGAAISLASLLLFAALLVRRPTPPPAPASPR